MGKATTLAAPPSNHLLESLPPDERETLMEHLRAAHLTVKTVLFDPGQPIPYVHFPIDGVISLVTPLADGNIVEVATIGNEGIVGVPLVPGGSLAVRAISQVGGRTLRIESSAFIKGLERLPAFRALVQKYVQALFGQISQAAACNRLHSNEERLSRWLLMSHDRVGTDTFPITHEFLGQMLGSRRATVTLSAGLLQSAGLIRYHRGRVTIVDREGLESVSCECYGIIKAALDRVVSPD
jgi:CRP-like cAMP-binding protein